MSLPGRFLNIGGQRVFVHRADRSGQGRPLVLLHGFMLSHYVFRHLIPALSAEHDVIAVDLPGFGESDRPTPAEFRYDEAGYLETVIGILDALAIDRASLLGHEMGGGIALYAAARRPERVERVVVLDPLVYDLTLPLEGRVLLTPYLGPLAFKTLYTRTVIRRYLLRDVYRDPALVTEEWVDYLWERLNRPGGFDAAHAAIRFLADPSAITRSLRAIRAPTLAFWGQDDRLSSSALARRFEGDVPGSVVHVLPRCGHSPVEECPDEVLRLIQPFLATGEFRRPAIAAVPT
jgi:pimeloyl-ACP methyl ester carboxylesterase